MNYNQLKHLILRYFSKIKKIRVIKKANIKNMDFSFEFDIQKTIEASSIILKQYGGSIKYLKFLKIIYISDRIAIEKIGQSITGDNYVSMEYGPVLSIVYDLIKRNNIINSPNVNSIWNEHILSIGNYTISLKKEPHIQELREIEIKILKNVCEEYRTMDRFKVAELTHNFPEWEKPSENKNAIPIKTEYLLKLLGKNDDEISYIKKVYDDNKILKSLVNECQ